MVIEKARERERKIEGEVEREKKRAAIVNVPN